MCGIFLAIPKSNYRLNIQACEKALNYLKKRGPDWHFKKIINKKFFGQTVLSMTGANTFKIENHISKDGRYLTLFNGEIYNYKELAKNFGQNNQKNFSDTQILVNNFKSNNIKNFFEKLDGMFAIIIYDKIKDRVIVARDLQGEKTLNVYEDKNLIIISSEINAIKVYIDNLKLDHYWLQTYFNTRHFLQFNNSIYKKVKIVQPGEILEINKLNQIKYLYRQEISNLVSEKLYNYNLKRKEHDLLEELEFLLRKNIKEMIPFKRSFCSIISGGVDSSLVSYYLSEISKPKKYLSLNHIGKDRISNNINKFQKYFSSEIKSLKINQSLYLKYLKKSLKICSSPINSHDFPGKLILAEYAKKIKTKAIFGGDGADELFGGYETYRQKIKDPKENNSAYTKYIENKLLISKDQNLFRNKLNLTWKKSLDSYDFIQNLETRNRLAMMLNDSSMQLASVGLRGCDLMFMNYSIESRSLFLRKDIIKFALNLPLKFKINLGNNKSLKNKIILKSLFLKYFPKKLLFKKQGFAGFPNETKKNLGRFENYKFNKILLNKEKNLRLNFNREKWWKIYNLEHFLRI